MIPSVVGAKLGATLAGFAVGLAGAGVAAYSGSLPPTLQNAAHAAIGAPAAPPNDTSAPAPGKTKDDQGSGPDATGPAAHGLCNAWSQHQRNGATPTGSVAFRNLAEAAGGESKIAAYCATVPHPGQGHGAAKGEKNGHGKGHGKDKDDTQDKEKGSETGPGMPGVPKPTSTSQSSVPRTTPSTTTTTPTPTSTARSTTPSPSTTATSSTSSSTSSP